MPIVLFGGGGGTPPSELLTSILTTDTFRTWFNATNDIIDRLNQNVLRNGIVANGTFIANGSLQVLSTFVANNSMVALAGNTRFDANVTVTSSSNVWNFGAGTFILQPLNGTTVNSAITLNAVATFLKPLTANANVTITSNLALTGDALFNGTLTSNNGPAVVRQVLYASSGAMCAPAALASPQYDDFANTGLAEAQVLNLTPNINCVFTGIASPTIAAGGRILYLQNQSTTFTITLVSGNTSSSLFNRFKLSGDAPLDVSPGCTVALLWTTVNKTWRPLGTAAITGAVGFGNTTISGYANVIGNLQVAGLTLLTGNTDVTGYVNVASTLRVAGLTTLVGNTECSGYANVAGTFRVAGLTTLVGNSSVTGTLVVGSNTTINGARLFANGQVRCDTLNGRLVLPVGAGLFAT